MLHLYFDKQDKNEYLFDQLSFSKLRSNIYGIYAHLDYMHLILILSLFYCFFNHCFTYFNYIFNFFLFQAVRYCLWVDFQALYRISSAHLFPIPLTIFWFNNHSFYRYFSLSTFFLEITLCKFFAVYFRAKFVY